MTKLYRDSVWFTKSRMARTLTIYRQDAKFYIQWDGEMKEVAIDSTGFYATVEDL